MRHVTAPWLLAAAIPALALAACGDGGGGDRGEIEDVIGLAANSEEKACEKFTDGLLQREFNGSQDTCKKQAGASDTKIEYDVKAVDISGDRATATVTAQNRTQTLRFVNDGGDWKLDRIGEQR